MQCAVINEVQKVQPCSDRVSRHTSPSVLDKSAPKRPREQNEREVTRKKARKRDRKEGAEENNEEKKRELLGVKEEEY